MFLVELPPQIFSNKLLYIMTAQIPNRLMENNMRKDKSFSTKQIVIMLLICFAMAAAYFAMIYFFGRSVANAVLMWGLIIISLVVIVFKTIKGKL